MSDSQVQFGDVLSAAEVIDGVAHRTPIATCQTLDGLAGRRLFFKCENLQKVGAFKFRGAFNAVSRLSEEAASAGVVTHSSGNHAQALAFAARMRGIPAFIVMPVTASVVKQAAVRDYGAEVLGVTLSKEQHAMANARAEKAGLADRAKFELLDYRKVEGQFDRIVSVGMFEHVGIPHYTEYFRNVSERLTPDGVALIHTIGRAEPPGTTSPWITKYIFPGGYVPSMSEALKAIEKQPLYTTDVEIWRLHYAETLRHWYDRFTANIDKARALYDERFCRMWRYYLVACELTFRLNRQVVFQFQLSPKQDAVPLTRDYLYPDNEKDSLRHAAE